MDNYEKIFLLDKSRALLSRVCVCMSLSRSAHISKSNLNSRLRIDLCPRIWIQLKTNAHAGESERIVCMYVRREINTHTYRYTILKEENCIRLCTAMHIRKQTRETRDICCASVQRKDEIIVKNDVRNLNHLTSIPRARKKKNLSMTHHVRFITSEREKETSRVLVLTWDSSLGKVWLCEFLSALALLCCCWPASDLRSCLHLSTPIMTALQLSHFFGQKHCAAMQLSREIQNSRTEREKVYTKKRRGIYADTR